MQLLPTNYIAPLSNNKLKYKLYNFNLVYVYVDHLFD